LGSSGSERNKRVHELKYLTGYSEKITGQVNQLISEDRLGNFLLKKYPSAHDIVTESPMKRGHESKEDSGQAFKGAKLDSFLPSPAEALSARRSANSGPPGSILQNTGRIGGYRKQGNNPGGNGGQHKSSIYGDIAV
jgi:hypothetical protein